MSPHHHPIAILFTYGNSSSACASFPVVRADAGFGPGPATLNIELYGGTRSLTLQSTPPKAVCL